MTSVRDSGVVEFLFFRPSATSVAVAGNFNDWRENELSMKPVGDGWWTAKARLDAGEYRFKYVADGEWYTDYAAYGIEKSPFGWDSVVVVPKKKRSH